MVSERPFCLFFHYFVLPLYYQNSTDMARQAEEITPFVGKQLEICEAFGFIVPDNCTPKYKSKKVKAKGPGRPHKAKNHHRRGLIVQTELKLGLES